MLVDHHGLVHVPPSLRLASLSQRYHYRHGHRRPALNSSWVLAVEEVELTNVDNQGASFNSIFQFYPSSSRQVGAVRAGEIFIQIYLWSIRGCAICSQNYGIIFKRDIESYIFNLCAAAALSVDHDVDDNDSNNYQQGYDAPQETRAAFLIRI